ncbi:hypothetical protein L211DRAFT_776074 [Terfezia boudieri ATCC MYA-4762]|uniref:RecQ-mediated genome instability protein 1 n=1 Tax=Terfezia boudieri ATCC MYA-4762 TaxID=1051890 RepID=A0A3N4M2S5_9PEZI|nr:hypothetical protein L211DRAFT_776074 [Terfezia boudieri ATCC MYA-4762]
MEHLLTRLASILSIHPSPTYLATHLQSLPNNNENALLASLRYRLINSDFTQSLLPQANTTFPSDLHTNQRYLSPAPGATLPGPIAVQIVDIVDLGSSNMEQLESLEMAGRGEAKKGREVIRVLPVEEEVGTQAPEGARAAVNLGTMKATIGPHKVLMEDASGRRAWGFEIERIPGLGIGGKMKLGAKLVLKNVPVMRELVILQPSNTTVLGGGVRDWDKAWIETRKAQLEASLGIGKKEEGRAR